MGPGAEVYNICQGPHRESKGRVGWEWGSAQASTHRPGILLWLGSRVGGLEFHGFTLY